MGAVTEVMFVEVKEAEEADHLMDDEEHDTC